MYLHYTPLSGLFHPQNNLILCENSILFCPAVPFAAASGHRRVSRHIYKKGGPPKRSSKETELDFIQAPKFSLQHRDSRPGLHIFQRCMFAIALQILQIESVHRAVLGHTQLLDLLKSHLLIQLRGLRKSLYVFPDTSSCTLPLLRPPQRAVPDLFRSLFLRRNPPDRAFWVLTIVQTFKFQQTPAPPITCPSLSSATKYRRLSGFSL